jgi:hypothetical protein
MTASRQTSDRSTTELRFVKIQGMEMHAHVRLSGDRAGEYVVTEERPDGSLTLVPDTSWRAIRERSGAREATKEEWEDFLTEHGPHMQPLDGEG